MPPAFFLFGSVAAPPAANAPIALLNNYYLKIVIVRR
jgi:hypothetical protein